MAFFAKGCYNWQRSRENWKTPQFELFNLLSRDNSNVFKSFFQPRECQNSPEFDKLRYRISSNRKEDKDMFVFIKNYYQKVLFFIGFATFLFALDRFSCADLMHLLKTTKTTVSLSIKISTVLYNGLTSSRNSSTSRLAPLEAWAL